MHAKSVYPVFALVGTVVPWYFFQSFFAHSGVDIPLFAVSLFANGAAGGFAADVLISILVFLYWVWRDGREKQVAHRWLVVPAVCAVGLSLALPLYLYLRERAISAIPG